MIFHAHIEPDRAVEGGLLVDQQVGEFPFKDPGIMGGGEVSRLLAPAGDGFGHPVDQGFDAGFGLGGILVGMKILGGDDIERGLAPEIRGFDIFALKNDLTLVVGDGSASRLPDQRVVRVHTGLGEETWYA